MDPLQLVELLRGHRTYIQTHNFPDPDAIASAFGLQHFLNYHGINADICYDGKKLIQLENITKTYDGNMILDDLNLYVKENEFLTLLGPSGCGKTTTLRLIGGFETPDTGRIIF
jgi:ABC-type glutathione transport system ATPase component